MVIIVQIAVLLVVLIVVRADEDRWEGLTPYTTTNGWACVSPCEKRGKDYFWCYTRESRAGWIDSYGGSWAHCSPSNGLDYTGNTCYTECKSYMDYYYCYTDYSHSNWNYCGKTLDTTPEQIVIGQYKTINGKYCVSACEKAGKSYNWCYQEGGSWDYCSAKGGWDYYDKKCKNHCDYHGQSYTWCWLMEGSWNYCGAVEVSSETWYTYVGSKCVTPCKHSGGSSYKCYDATKEELLCSPVAGVTVTNKKCALPCSFSGSAGGTMQPYYWCWTKEDKSEWDYCSIPKDDPREGETEERGLQPRGWNKREYFPKLRIRLDLTRTGSLENIYRHSDNQALNEVTFFERMDRSGNNAQYEATPELTRWAYECLDDWQRQSYQISDSRHNTVTLANGGGTRRTGGPNGVRLDQQTRYTRDGIEYVNLQLQVNGISRETNGGRSTTLAEVQVPVDVVADMPRQVSIALLRSLWRAFAVHIRRFEY